MRRGSLAAVGRDDKHPGAIAGRMHQHDLTTVIACAFDHRTRILPFILPTCRWYRRECARSARPWSIRVPQDPHRAAAMEQAIRPAEMRLDGRIPILSWSPACTALRGMRSADPGGMPDRPAQRPLIIAGGPRIIYEPWQVFRGGPAGPLGCRRGRYRRGIRPFEAAGSLLSLGPARILRSAFLRARDSGAGRNPGAGLRPVIAPGGPAEELVDTGIQRLLGDLDELPHPVLGYRLLEPPSAESHLGARMRFPPIGYANTAWFRRLC